MPKVVVMPSGEVMDTGTPFSSLEIVCFIAKPVNDGNQAAAIIIFKGTEGNTCMQVHCLCVQDLMMDMT